MLLFPARGSVTDFFTILTGKPTGKRLLGGLGTDGRTILIWKLKRNWVDLAQDKDYWRALVHVVLIIMEFP